MRSVERRESSDGVKIFSAADRQYVLSACREWADKVRAAQPSAARIGLFGSYARGDHAPGSDIDLLVVVAGMDSRPWFMRSADFDTSTLPVGADVFVYTEEEAGRMKKTNAWFRHVLSEMIWL